MKIGLLGTAADSEGVVPNELIEVVDQGTELALYAAKISIFAYTPVEFAIQQLNYLETGLRAAADDCDALVYVSMADYGISALRSAVDIPVIGAGEATFKFGMNIGSRFSIVTVWPKSTNFIHHNTLREHGLSSRLVSIRNVMDEKIIASGERPDGFIAEMQSGNDQTFERILASCNSAIDDDGAEFIILGCTCMSPIAARVAAQSRVPVINPFATAVKTAESMLKLSVRPQEPVVLAARPASLELIAEMVKAGAVKSKETEPSACTA